MKLSKNRLEAFSDGVIAIIITIMVLSIPLPASFAAEKILAFLLTIFIYLVSYVVVGSFWNIHHHVFARMEKVTGKVVTYNLAFLFFLSLIPIFTRWVMENPGVMVPAIAYDLAYVLSSLCSVLIFRAALDTETREKMVKMRERQKHARGEQTGQGSPPPGVTWIRFAGIAAAAAVIIALSLAVPAVSTVFLLGLPVVFSVANVIADGTKGRVHHRAGNHPDQSERVFMRDNILQIIYTDEKDIPFAEEAERRNAKFVGQWTVQQHLMALRDPDLLHLLIRDNLGRNVGFAILRGITHQRDNIELMRVVITEEDLGYGKAALSLVRKWAFEVHHAHRLWLDVRESNTKARHIYESLGFQQEGMLREAVNVDGGRQSLVVMSILAAEYDREQLNRIHC